MGVLYLVSFSCVPVGFALVEVTGFEVANRKAQVRTASTDARELGSLCCAFSHTRRCARSRDCVQTGVLDRASLWTAFAPRFDLVSTSF